jgi:hypothetical protein
MAQAEIYLQNKDTLSWVQTHTNSITLEWSDGDTSFKIQRSQLDDLLGVLHFIASQPAEKQIVIVREDDGKLCLMEGDSYGTSTYTPIFEVNA